LPDVINQKLNDNAVNRFTTGRVHRVLTIADAQPLGRFNPMLLIFYFSVMDKSRDKTAFSLSLILAASLIQF
jgi:hypothetical protein